MTEPKVYYCDARQSLQVNMAKKLKQLWNKLSADEMIREAPTDAEESVIVKPDENT